MTHPACGGVVTHRLVLDDRGGAAVIRWCAACDMALGIDDVPEPFTVAEVPSDMIAALLLTATEGEHEQ